VLTSGIKGVIRAIIHSKGHVRYPGLAKCKDGLKRATEAVQWYLKNELSVFKISYGSILSEGPLSFAANSRMMRPCPKARSTPFDCVGDLTPASLRVLRLVGLN